MQNVLKTLNQVSKTINELQFAIHYMESLTNEKGYRPNYPNKFVVKLIKAAEITEEEICTEFYVCMDRAIKYRYVKNLSPQIKDKLVKFALRKMLNE